VRDEIKLTIYPVEEIICLKNNLNLAVTAELNIGTTSHSLTGRYKVALFHEMADLLSTIV